uniref:RIIa domain-containing protein n=1 Tax=Trichuris muris TaxID=70415 RepID=A0A5S6QSM5_TRIMR
MNSDASSLMDDISTEYQLSTESEDECDQPQPVSSIVNNYLNEHNIAGLMKTALVNLCMEMPDDPVMFLHLHFMRLCSGSPKESSVSDGLLSNLNFEQLIGEFLLHAASFWALAQSSDGLVAVNFLEVFA